MKWTSTYQHPDNLNFVIQSEVFTNTSTNEELEWYYVYVYENPEFYKKDLQSKDCGLYQRDHLQHSYEQALSFSESQFGVPEDSWVEVSEQIA